MKPNFIITLCLLFMGIMLHAQCPVNSVPPTPWQWWLESEFEMYIANQTPYPQIVESPFFPNPSQNTNFLVADPDDNNPVDGWELLYKQFGTAQNPKEIPSFALYNKYTGKLRVFAYNIQGNNGDWDTGYNNIEFIGGQETALFSHMTTPTGALDNFIKGLSSQTINRVYYGNAQWYLYEFTTAYDPCSCQSDVGLNILSLLSDIDNLELEISGTSYSKPIIENNQPTGPLGSSEFLISTNKGLSKGLKIFKDANQFGKDITNILSKLIPPQIIPGAPGGGSGSPLANLPDWLQTIPKIGWAFSVASALFGGGSNSATVKPVSYSTQYNLQASGSVNEEINYALEIINTPGTNGGNNLPVHYDNILGVMNILNTPDIFFAESSEFHGDQCFEYLDRKASYNLRAPLDYIVNPASGLSAEPAEIKAAIYFDHCQFSDEPGLVNSGVIPLPNGKGRTPYMPLSCLAGYSVQTGFIENTQNCTTTVHPNGFTLLDGSPEYIHVVALFDNPSGSDEKIVYAAAYNYNIMAAPYTFGMTPFNPFLLFDENLTLEDPGQITSQGQPFFAWNEINIALPNFPPGIDMIRVFTQNLTFENGAFTAMPGVFADPFGRYKLYRLCPIGDICVFIRHYFQYEPCPETPPASLDDVATFCNTTYKDQQFNMFPPAEFRKTTNAFEAADTQLYPNPAGASATLNVDLVNAGNVTIELYESTGRLIEVVLPETRMAQGAHQFQINTADLQPGYYLVKYQIDDKVQTLKLIK